MIEDFGIYYLYRHIRLDKNEPFYIGIGTKRKNVKHFTSYKDEYSRAFRKSRKKEFWDNITHKTNYDIEILLESNDYAFIKQKEIEFIRLYGRRNLSLGPLVNLTDGGEGTTGYKMSEEHINRQQKSWKRKTDKECTSSKKVYQYTKEGDFIKEWFCITTASKETKILAGNICNAAKNTRHFSNGFLWFYEDQGSKVKKDNGRNSPKRKV